MDRRGCCKTRNPAKHSHTSRMDKGRLDRSLEGCCNKRAEVTQTQEKAPTQEGSRSREGVKTLRQASENIEKAKPETLDKNREGPRDRNRKGGGEKKGEMTSAE